jgi:hypothetical protein
MLLTERRAMIDPTSNEAIIARHRDYFRTVHPDIKQAAVEAFYAKQREALSTLNPEKIGFMQLADTDILVEAATGGIDLNQIAREILANRGFDQKTGRWIGFDAAREQLKAQNAN